MLCEKGRLVVAAAALVIAPQGLRCGRPIHTVMFREELEHQLYQPQQRDAVRSMHAFVEPVAELHERGEGGRVSPKQWRALDEVSAVADELPILRKASKPLHLGE